MMMMMMTMMMTMMMITMMMINDDNDDDNDDDDDDDRADIYLEPCRRFRRRRKLNNKILMIAMRQLIFKRSILNCHFHVHVGYLLYPDIA